MFTGPTLGPVSELALGSWARKRRPSPDSSWPFSTKVLCHSYKPSLAAGCPSLWVFALFWGAGFSMWEPLFCTEVTGFFREPTWCLLPYFLFLIYASGCSRHHLLDAMGLPTHSCLSRGRWNLLRVGMCQLSNLAKGGAYVCACTLQGKGKAGDLLLPFAVGLKEGGPKAWQMPLLANLENSK